VVRRLSLHVARRLDGLLQGEHLGFLPGPGSEPAEARPYGLGDDVRRIDWSVTARTGETHVRTTVSERELETTILVDLTGSMAFGTRTTEKRDLAISVTAAVLHLARGAGDRTGAVLLTPLGAKRIPPRAGRDAVLATLHAILHEPRADGAGPDLATALQGLLLPPRRRGLVVVVSDLLSGGTDPEAVPSWQRPLALLGQRHDTMVVEVVDPRELTLPDVGTLRLVDPETGRQVDVATTRAVRERYAAAAAARRATHARAARSAGASHVALRTDGDWLVAFASFLQARRRTRGSVARAGRR
jgi:uncharacterized protein (DUF58 family)